LRTTCAIAGGGAHVWAGSARDELRRQRRSSGARCKRSGVRTTAPASSAAPREVVAGEHLRQRAVGLLPVHELGHDVVERRHAHQLPHLCVASRPPPSLRLQRTGGTTGEAGRASGSGGRASRSGGRASRSGGRASRLAIPVLSCRLGTAPAPRRPCSAGSRGGHSGCTSPRRAPARSSR
jgi:hypothetical protein